MEEEAILTGSSSWTRIKLVAVVESGKETGTALTDSAGHYPTMIISDAR
jgi:hypothetical protein